MKTPVSLLSTGLGLAMVAASAAGAHRGAPVAAVIAAAAVVVAIAYLPAATLAVLATVVVIAIGDTPPVFAAMSGLTAVAYLAARTAATGAVTAMPPTLIAAAGFSIAGLIAAAFPLRVPWLPLLAPLGVLGIYALAISPFLSDRR